jgi:hypothetical protein
VPLGRLQIPGGHDRAHSAAAEGRVRKNPGLKKKKPAPWVFCFFGIFFLYIFVQKREFLGFFQFQEYF